MALHRFAIVVENEVAGTITLNDESPVEATPRLLAAFQSDPKIIPIRSGEPVDYGWFWNGTAFFTPNQEK